MASVIRQIAAGLALWLCAQSACAQNFNEYQLKAVFLLRFTQFVEWPPANAPGSAFNICVLGTDPFDSYLEDTVRNETVRERAIAVRRLETGTEPGDCQILYVSDSERPRIKQIAGELRGRGVLTVGDSDSFAQQGGIIEFVTADRRIRLKINVAAARAANLQISSKLLRPATIVGGDAP
jgi:hypothetical protein